MPLDETSLPYIRINLLQVTKKYDSAGKETKTVISRPVGPCPEEFYKTEYEKQFYTAFGKGGNLLCSPDDSVYLQGTRDSKVALKEHSYLIYEFLKCTESQRKDGDPPCESMKNINKWLSTKAAHMRVLNMKIDFTLYSDQIIRQNEIWLPAVQLKAGIYTDQGYRFRENTFEKADHIIPGAGEGAQRWFDITFFSSDPIVVGDDFTILAEMYFRVKSDSISHSRSVYTIMDWLGDLGGIGEILKSTAALFLGGYF